MSVRTPDRRRAKVSVTIAPELLRAVDAFVLEHPGSDRSKVVDEALWLWCGREQTRAMEEQFNAPVSAEELAERADWRRIQRAAAERIFDRTRKR